MSTTARPLRADAERNKRLLLDAAKELFAERGLHVSLDDIAKRAGVGVGTAYRRFGSRSELIEALFDERVEQMVALAESCLEIEDPWLGLVTFIESSTELQASDRGLKEILLGSVEGQEKIGQIRERMRPLATQLVERAKESGQLRDDFMPQDLPMLQIMLGGIADASSTVEPELWRRYLALLLVAMRAEGELGSPPPDWDRLDQVLQCWRPPRRD
jgi:AcrR family transcriptional regulator